MQIRKSYKNVNPELLYDEVKDFVQRQGAAIAKDKLETYSLPTDSSSFIHRGTLIFNLQEKECIRVHIVGSDKSEIKMIMDIEDALFPNEKVKALEDDLNFIFGSYEITSK